MRMGTMLAVVAVIVIAVLTDVLFVCLPTTWLGDYILKFLNFQSFESPKF